MHQHVYRISCFAKRQAAEILYIAINLLMILSIQGLSKKYRKEKFGLKDYSITIENGILGLLGPNGAGKSTLMKIIATISRPTEGTLTLDGMIL